MMSAMIAATSVTLDSHPQRTRQGSGRDVISPGCFASTPRVCL